MAPASGGSRLRRSRLAQTLLINRTRTKCLHRNRNRTADALAGALVRNQWYLLHSAYLQSNGEGGAPKEENERFGQDDYRHRHPKAYFLRTTAGYVRLLVLMVLRRGDDGSCRSAVDDKRQLGTLCFFSILPSFAVIVLLICFYIFLFFTFLFNFF